jgi:molecular chaperone DnaK
VHAARKTLEEAGEHATDDERAAIEAAITEVEGAVQGDDAAAMEAATAKLTEVTGGVAQKMYAAQQTEGAAAGAEGAEAQPEEADQGDVVDAEFEEVKEDKRA